MTQGRYERRAVEAEIEAIQFDGNVQALWDFGVIAFDVTRSADDPEASVLCGPQGSQGTRIAKVDDWIVRPIGAVGLAYNANVMRSGEFAATYAPTTPEAPLAP